MLGRTIKAAEPAPGAYSGADKAPPFSWLSARQNLLLPYLAPLVFFVFSIASVFDNAALNGSERAFCLVNIAVLLVMFAGANQAVELSERWRVLYCLSFIGVILLAWPWQGAAVLQNALFVPTLCALMLPPTWAHVIGVPWGVGVLIVGMIIGDQLVIFFGAMAAALVIAISLALRLARSEAALGQARLELEQAMLAAERERIARDMHDILGQSLTAIALKGDVVDRALGRNPAMARTELDELRTIARSALTDLRATTTGLRTVEIRSELASARALLRAAGIEVQVRLSDPLPEGEAAAFVVREAATNAARHSKATRCEIIVRPDEVTITDDGCGLPAQHSGSGLPGLRRRVQEAGGQLEITARHGGGTVVRARFCAPNSEPVDLCGLDSRVSEGR